MRGAIYKDFLAIRFIRCLAPVPNSGFNAGGAGFTLDQAIAKCESELVEREFEGGELRPNGIRPVGIAAHPIRERARSNATQEAVETICLQQVRETGEFQCRLLIRFPGFRFGIAATGHGYFAMIVAKVGVDRVAAHSAHANFFGVLLKVWEEYQSMRFFRPGGDRLKRYTKANFLFSTSELKSLSFVFKPQFVYHPSIQGLKFASAERGGRHVAYFFQ